MEFWVQDLGLRVHGCGCRVYVLKFKVWELGPWFEPGISPAGMAGGSWLCREVHSTLELTRRRATTAPWPRPGGGGLPPHAADLLGRLQSWWLATGTWTAGSGVPPCYARTGMYSMTFSMIDSHIALTVAFLFISPLLDSGSSSKEV